MLESHEDSGKEKTTHKLGTWLSRSSTSLEGTRHPLASLHLKPGREGYAYNSYPGGEGEAGESDV